MRPSRYFLLFLLILLFPVGQLSLFAQATSGGGSKMVRIFRSNSLGMPLEEISVYRRDEFDFILERAEDGRKTSSTLYFRGKETALWERTYGAGGDIETEKEIRDDEVIERIFRQGFLEEETTVYPDGRKERVRYTYRDGQILGIRKSNEETAGLETRLDYRIGPDGRLLGVSQKEDGEEVRRTEFSYQKEGGYGEWHQQKGQIENYQFREGRPVLQEQWQGGELFERVVWSEEDGQSYRVREFPGEGRILIDLLDEDGFVLGQEERTSEGSIYREFTYINSNLAEMIERRPGEKRRYTYIYGPDGLIEERMERNELLATRILYLPEGRERHETYRRGLLLMVVEYQDGIPLESTP